MPRSAGRTRAASASHAVALGDEADVDAGDVLDYLASDPGTRAILLELDSVKSARKFMSAARAAARNKPVLALRTGRADPGDALYTAAFQRAGMVRVEALDDLLDEVETLGVGRIANSNAATVITSDAGVAKLAVDALGAAGDLRLAPWPAAATEALAAVLPLPRGIEAGNPCCSATTRGPRRSAPRCERSARTARRARCSWCMPPRTTRPSRP